MTRYLFTSSYTFIAIYCLIIGEQQLPVSAKPFQCSLKSADGKSSHCTVLRDNKYSIKLIDCKRAENDAKPDTDCNSIFSKSQSWCRLSIEMLNFVEHEAIGWRLPNQCDSGIPEKERSHLKIKSVNIDRAKPVVKNSAQIPFVDLILEDVNMSVGLSDFLRSQLRESSPGSNETNKLETINIKRLETKLGITNGTFDFNEYPELRSLIIEDSTIKGGLSSKSIRMGRNFRNLTMRNLKLKDSVIGREAIVLSRNPEFESEPFHISIENSDLTSSSTGNDFIVLDKKPESYKDRLALYMSLTGNLFDQILPEERFSKFLSRLLEDDDIFTFKFDKIACCSSENRWLFQLNLAKYKNARLFIDCSDIEHDVYRYKNETELDGICESRNSQPILIIAISSILLLALLLAAFSFVCIYYVLPKRGPVIVINSRTKLATSSGAKSSTDVVAEVQSTGTATTQATKNPLLSSGSNYKEISSEKPILAATLRSALKTTKSAKSTKSTRSHKSQLVAPGLPRVKFFRLNRQQARPHKQ